MSQLFCQHFCIAALAFILFYRFDTAVFQLWKSLKQKLSARLAKLIKQALARILCCDRYDLLCQDISSIQSLIHLHDRHAGFFFSVDDRPLDRCCPSVLRQKGSMDIDTAKARHFQYFFGQDLPESRYHKQIRIILLQLCYRFRPFDSLRLQNRDLMLHGAYLDRRRHKLLTPALRSVRLCHDCQHFYTA